MKFAIIPLLLLVLLAGCSSDTNLGGLPTVANPGAGASVGGGNPNAGDIIQVGDKLEIYVLEDESFNGIYTVRDGGHIIFPKAGRVQVAGLTLGGAEAAIKTSFEGPAQLLRKATIILERHGVRATEAGPGQQMVTIYLSGEVKKSGPISVPFIDGLRPTAYQALVHGGGPRGFPKLSKAYIIRNTGTGRKRIDVNLSDVGKGKSQDVQIQNGDILVIPAKGLF